MINCEKATLLMVKSSEVKLSTGEKMSLKFHTMFCKACKLFQTQNQLIDQAMASKNSVKEEASLSSAKKEELKSIINKEIDQ